MDNLAASTEAPEAPRTDVRIYGVPSDEARALWPHVVGFVKPALDIAGGAYLPEHVLADIVSRDSQLWIAVVGDRISGCVISRILRHPNLSEIFCPVVGGDGLDVWGAPLFERIEAFARSVGATRIEGVGRRGWARALPGMKEVGSLMRKVL